MKTYFRIYYRGDKTFDSDNGSWSEAPAEGVLLVVEKRGDQVNLRMGWDHYQLEPDGSVITRDTRSLLAAIGLVSMSPIKFGFFVSATEMERIVNRARAEFIQV